MLTILEKTDLLQDAALFREVRTQSLARIAAISFEVRFEARQPLFNEHEAADAMFVILDGEVNLSRAGSAAGSVTRGQIAGSLDLLAGLPRTEAAVAGRPVWALRIGQQALFDAMAEDFHITRGVLHALAVRGSSR